MRKSKIPVLSMRDAMDEVIAEKGINQETLVAAIQEAVAEAFRRNFETEIPVRAELKEGGHFRIFAGKTVVETVADPISEVAQSDPRAKGYGLGDSIEVEMKSEEMGAGAKELTDEFSRVAALLAKQVIRQRLREAERRLVYEEFKGREGEMVHGKVQRVRHGTLIVELGRTEAILPRRELPMREKYKEGDRVKAVIMEVRLGPKGPQIVLSRAHPWLVQRLFEMEVTEVFDKTVEIKAMAREAGYRTKVAVVSRDQNVDPVGACVGQKGIRVQTIVRELGGEKIDIVHWDAEPTVFIRNALSPAECERVIIHESTRTAEIIVRDDHQSLAIGKEGQNARLAAKLTGWKIEIHGAGAQPKDVIDELMSQMTLGATPEEILAHLGIGAETAPAFLAAGLDSIEKVASASDDVLAGILGMPAVAVASETEDVVAEDVVVEAVAADEAVADEAIADVAVVSPTAAAGLGEAARVLWNEVKLRFEEVSQGGPQQSHRGERRPRRDPADVKPYTLPNGIVVANAAELTAALDALPGDQLESILQAEELKNWIQDIGMQPAEISDLMQRYR